MKKKLIIILSVVIGITVLMVSSLMYMFSKEEFKVNEFKDILFSVKSAVDNFID